MIIIVLLTLATLAVDLVFKGIMLVANLGNLGLSLLPWALLITTALLISWLIRD